MDVDIRTDHLLSPRTTLVLSRSDVEGLVTMARQSLAEARHRRLNSNPDLAIEARGPRPLQDANDEVGPTSSSSVTPVEEPPHQKWMTSSAVPFMVLVLLILAVVLVVVTI